MSESKRPGQTMDPNASLPAKVPRLTQPVAGHVRPAPSGTTAELRPRIPNNNVPVQYAAPPAPQQQVFGAVGHGRPTYNNGPYFHNTWYLQHPAAPSAPAPTQMMVPNIGLPAGQYHNGGGAPTYPGQPSTYMDRLALAQIALTLGQERFEQLQGEMSRLVAWGPEMQALTRDVLAHRQEPQQRVLSGTMERVLTTWSRCTTNERILFVAYGKVESIKPVPAGQKIFVMGPLLVPRGPQMQVTYYEMDRPLMDLQPEQKVMVTGVMLTDRTMQAFRVDKLTAEEEAALSRVMHVCDRIVADIARRH